MARCGGQGRSVMSTPRLWPGGQIYFSTQRLHRSHFLDGPSAPQPSLSTCTGRLAASVSRLEAPQTTTPHNLDVILICCPVCQLTTGSMRPCCGRRAASGS